MARDSVTFGEAVGPDNRTFVTVKIEDTSKGGRLEIKVEHRFDTEIGSAEDNCRFVEQVYANLYERLNPHAEARPPR